MTETTTETIDYAARREIFREALNAQGITRCVLVTGSFRAGTSFVCSLLGKNGLPSVVNEKFRNYFECRHPGSEAQLRDKLDATFATAEDGLFCAKIMWPHRNDLAMALGFERADSADFARLFPQAKWINIVRRDKIAQSISFWKAKQTDRWHVFKKEKEPEVEYDFDGLRAAMAELSVHDRLWRIFYRLAGIAPAEVVYEEFQKNVPEHLARLVEFVGPEHRLEAGPLSVEVGLKKQRDANSEALRRKFLDDSFRAGN